MEVFCINFSHKKAHWPVIKFPNPILNNQQKYRRKYNHQEYAEDNRETNS